MRDTQKKKQNGSLKRRGLAIIAAILLIAILSATLVGVLKYAKIDRIDDPADGTTYYIRNDTGVYLLYDKEKNIMPDGGVDGKNYFKTYKGTLIEVKPDTGAAKVIAAIDVPDASLNETSTYSSILPYSNVAEKQIRSLEIVNSEGSFRLVRYNLDGEQDDSADLILEGYVHVPFDRDAFARLCNTAGSPFCKKLENPKKDANGAYTEYGLAPETRVNDEGETYDYVPDYFIMTDTSGKQYKMLVGDKLVTGQGYYVQYCPQNEKGEFIPRDVVYIIGTSAGEAMKNGVEKLVSPILCYPMDSSTYYKVKNLMVLERDESKTAKYDSILPSVSYIPLEERRNTVNGMRVYQYNDELRALIPDADHINFSMNGLFDPEVEEVVAFAPSLEELASYGFYRQVLDENGNPVLDEKGNPKYEEAPAFRINFDYPKTVTNDDGTTTKMTVRNYILVAPVTEENEEGEIVETGDYYTYTYYALLDASGNPGEAIIYPWINHVKAETLSFLTWNRFDWTDEFVFSVDLSYLSKLTMTSYTSNYSASFELDNSMSSAPEGVMTVDHLTVAASDSNGNAFQTFQGLNKLHSYGENGMDLYWEITSNGVTVYDKDGNDLRISSDYYYAKNALGIQVFCLSVPLTTSDGTVVTVSPDTVTVTKNGKTTEYVRYSTTLFQKLYTKLMFVTSGGSYELSEEKEAALVADPSNLVMTFEVVENAGSMTKPNLVNNVYRFYSLQSEGSSRKLYMTVNGVGGFYVLRAQIESFVQYSQLFFANQPLE